FLLIAFTRLSTSDFGLIIGSFYGLLAAQSISYLFRSNEPNWSDSTHPDHVILTFHLNDFETTPVSFYQDKKLLVYAPNTRLENINPWLFQHSYFYRLVVGLMVSLNNSSREAIIQEVQDSLTEIRDILAEKNVEFTVLVLPYLKPYREWSPIEKSSRNQIISILNQNGIPHVDLFNLLKDAVRDGINIQEEMGDFYHPSEEIAFRFAKHINDNGIFTYPIDNGR
ncbi:MAG: hypothetical protein ISS12_14570, partial [Candidatus Marinimicrobia bacterium]|nr:hypothetical protein [Candidatus Neomarinimicrobiota bacterium]